MSAYSRLVYTDFVLAVLLTVLAPLALLVWSAARKNKPLIGTMIAYWRVSALLMVAVYLLIGGVPIAYLAGVAARVFIPLSLFWPLGETRRWDSLAGRVFVYWRRVVTLYCGFGVLVTAPLLGCTLRWAVSPRCEVWRGPPLEFSGVVHGGLEPSLAANLGWGGLIIYASVATWRLVSTLRAR
ncbi:MAG: DUF3177 family protein [Trueperaceae bacterium]|nr:DUF3177 family protein [Trueperaceae bacterium]